MVRGLQHPLKSITTKTITGNVLQKTATDVIIRRLGILESNKIVLKATFLDPRFRNPVLELIENANNAEKWLIDELSFILNDNQKEDTSCSVPTGVESNVLWKHFDTEVSQIKTMVSTRISASLIIRQYLEMPYLNKKT